MVQCLVWSTVVAGAAVGGLCLRLVGDLPFSLAEPLRSDDSVSFLELPWMCSFALGHICAGRSFGRLFENLAFGPHLRLLSKSGSSSIHSAFFLPPHTLG